MQRIVIRVPRQELSSKNVKQEIGFKKFKNKDVRTFSPNNL